MKIKYLFILFTLIYVIFSCSLVVASDNGTSDMSENVLNKEQLIINEEDTSLFEENNFGISQAENSLKDYNSIEIYVGENKTTDGGNGSYDNPYGTLDLACKNVNGEEKATINIFNGTYQLNSLLKFNTSNLVLNGLGNNCTIKGNAFAFYSSSANFTFNNLIFKSKAFEGFANYGTYNYCTFVGSFNMQGDSRWDCTGFHHYNFKAINCIFKNFNQDCLFGQELSGSNFMYFENCIFLNPKLDRLAEIISSNKNITMNGVWFGENKIADYTRNLLINLGSSWGGRKDIPIVKYAIFSVSENYLGNNQYEIVGKLTWNGTDSSEGMENFPPMTVTLTSTTGEIQSTATLINGSFKISYTSNSLDNNILAKLDYQKIILNFNTVNIQAEPANIYYGDDQNITLKFNKPITGLLNITINNKTYEKIKVDNTDLFVYTSKDILTEGNYQVNIVLYDDENTIHGLNSTELIVSKVNDYDFIPIMPADAKIGKNKISFELPSDATGNITIFLGKNNSTINISNNTEILMDGFVEGNNILKIIYSGDNRYANKTIDRIVTAEKFEVDLNTYLIFTPPSGNGVASYTFNLPTNVMGDITININGKNYTQPLINGNAIINIGDLAPDKYNAIIYYSGDDKFYSNRINTSFIIPKPILTAQNVSILYTSGKTYTVKVTLGGKPVTGKSITFNINGQTKTIKTDNNGYASLNINLPPKSQAYTITVNYLGVSVKNKITVKSIIAAKTLKVKKTAKKIKIKITLKKVDNKYLKGKQISLKFKGKIYKAKTNKKGVATFTIKNNIIKKLKVGKKYSYETTYLKDKVSKKITVKK